MTKDELTSLVNEFGLIMREYTDTFIVWMPLDNEVNYPQNMSIYHLKTDLTGACIELMNFNKAEIKIKSYLDGIESNGVIHYKIPLKVENDYLLVRTVIIDTIKRLKELKLEYKQQKLKEDFK